MLTEALVGAVAEAVFGYLLQQAGLGERIRTFLKLDPEHLAFKVAFARTYTAFDAQHPQWSQDLFDQQFLSHAAAPLLARSLLRDAPPVGTELAKVWADHLGLQEATRANWLPEATQVANDFLATFDAELRARDEFQPLFDSRALDTTAIATTQTAETTAEIASQLQVLRAELRDLFDLLARTQNAPIMRGTAPPVPALMIGRDSDLARLKQRIGINQPDQRSRSVNVLTAMRGWPGVGKTTLAAALAHDAEVAARFPDGVLWASLGQKPDLFGELAKWALALGIPDLYGAKTVEDVSQLLTGVLRTKRALLIVDDIWDESHLQPFRIGGANCALLLTTRLPEVARAIASPDQVYVLGVLDPEDALILLHTLAPSVVTANKAECRELVADLEGLPLALQVAGRLLQADAEKGFGVADLLRDLRDGAALIAAKAPADRTDIANQTTPTVAALLELSTGRLDENALVHFAYLGAFAPKPATFDLAAIKSVWEVDDPKPILSILLDRGLLEPINSRYWMHAILVVHARSFWADGGE